MGKRKPTALHIVTGTFRKTRANLSEPTPPPGIPRAPSYLSKRERAAWDRFAEETVALRVLTKSDFAALEQLVCAYAEAQDLRAFIRKNGQTYESTSEKGATLVRAYPQVRMMREVERLVLLLLGRFGLTPADRPGVSAAAASPDLGDSDQEFT